MAENSVFDSEKNLEIHNKNLELISLNTDIGSSSLKVLTTIIELLSNLSPTNLPNIATKIAGLANPLAEASAKVVKSKIEQKLTVDGVGEIQKVTELPDLDKSSPIEYNLNTPELNPDFSTDSAIGNRNRISGGLS